MNKNKSKKQDELARLVQDRYQIALDFTKEFQDSAKTFVEDYNAGELPRQYANDGVDRRYEIPIPLIFTNHESMMSSLFDRPPGVIFTGRKSEDEDGQQIVEAMFNYINDKVKLPFKMNQAAWWFILIGQASVHGHYLYDYEVVPVLDDNGEPMIDETGQEITRNKPIYDDPDLTVSDPYKEVYSPESQFTYEADEIPYTVSYTDMEVEQVYRVFGKKVDADTELDVDDKGTKSVKDDCKRARVYFYKGTIPEKYKGLVENWVSGKPFFIASTKTTVLSTETNDINDKNMRMIKWFGAPNSFFGFGIGKLLKPFQIEKTIRRGQQRRYADIAAFPKIAAKDDNKFDVKAMKDPRDQSVLLYEESMPQYLQAPNLGDAVNFMDRAADEDAQRASGLMDISAGAQQSQTVKTATGQQIFAEASDRRMRRAKQLFNEFYRATVIMLLKLAQENWTTEKIVNIKDEDGTTQELVLSAETVQDIDFDTDIDIDFEGVSVNKDVLRAQAIELFNMIVGLPFADQEAVFKDLMRDGFGKKNPDRYIKNDEEMMQEQQQGMSGGMSDGSQPMPDAPGQQPTGGQVPSDPTSVMANAQNV